MLQFAHKAQKADEEVILQWRSHLATRDTSEHASSRPWKTSAEAVLTSSFIVFRAADVKDLKIEQNAPVASQPPPMPEDPAIMSVSCENVEISKNARAYLAVPRFYRLVRRLKLFRSHHSNLLRRKRQLTSSSSSSSSQLSNNSSHRNTNSQISFSNHLRSRQTADLARHGVCLHHRMVSHLMAMECHHHLCSPSIKVLSPHKLLISHGVLHLI